MYIEVLAKILALIRLNGVDVNTTLHTPAQTQHHHKHMHGSVCPVITSVDVYKHMETGDTVYTCHVTAHENDLNSTNSDKP